jgi:hypothetical protein
MTLSEKMLLVGALALVSASVLVASRESSSLSAAQVQALSKEAALSYSWVYISEAGQTVVLKK